MSTRRNRQVDYDDDWYDDDDWGGGGGYPSKQTSKPKPKAKADAKAKGKAVTKPAASKASAAPATSAAATPKPASKPAAVDELARALGFAVPVQRVEEALASGVKAEDAFIRLLAEELDAGRWQHESKPTSKAQTVQKPEEAPGESQTAEAHAAQGKNVEKPEAAVEEMPAPPQAEEDTNAGEVSAVVMEPDDPRPCISLVVCGHVDAGKSTLMGHLLCLVGNVSSKEMHKFDKESRALGKASFKFAWVLDEGEDERARGVTIDVCVKHFATESRRFTILDAPGHRDFVPNMLQGAVQADAAIIVVDTTHFEAGFDRGGQTKEHLQLLRSLGISQLLVAVNKLDKHDWKQEVYEDIKSKVHGFVVGPECGFKAANVRYVPLSGFEGENMLERRAEGLKWWDGPTLVQALDALPPPDRPSSAGPLRLCISDLYKSGANTTVSGKIESGAITAGQRVMLMPSGELTSVKSLQTRGGPARSGHAGDYMDSVVLPVELQFASLGGVVCDPKKPVPISDAFQAQLLVFDLDIPLMRGTQLMCYVHTETLTATLTKLESLIVKGKPSDKRPKCLQKGNVAVVQLRVSRKVCIEPKPAGNAPVTALSRLVLRDRGRTVAAGVVLRVM